MLAYAYPKTKHIRSQSPPNWKVYSRYKATLREEFKKACVYCRKSDFMHEPEFGVDHYRPKSRFKELASTYSNLYYCCNVCNRLKGEYWPSSEELAKGLFVPNPCDCAMFSHVRFKAAVVDHRTIAGEWMVKLLRLNDDQAVKYREYVIALIASLLRTKGDLELTLAELEAADDNDFQEDKEVVLGELKVIEEMLSGLMP